MFLRHFIAGRTDVVIAVAVALVVLGGVSGALAIDLHHQGAERADCVAAWNAPSSRANQVSIARAGWKRAAVDGWMAEKTYPGCGVLLVHRPDKRWIDFGRQMPEGAWYRTSGLRWGHDSPDGPGAGVDDNARVSPSGLLRLD